MYRRLAAWTAGVALFVAQASLTQHLHLDDEPTAQCEICTHLDLNAVVSLAQGSAADHAHAPPPLIGGTHAPRQPRVFATLPRAPPSA